MKAKEYLQQLQQLDVAIDQKIKELNDLRAMLTTVGSFNYSKVPVQGSSSEDSPYVKVIDKIIDLEIIINSEIDRFVDKKHQVIHQIQQLEDTKYMNLLYKRYVEYKQLDLIAIEMNYTYQYTKELHTYALQEFESTYPNLP